MVWGVPCSLVKALRQIPDLWKLYFSIFAIDHVARYTSPCRVAQSLHMLDTCPEGLFIAN